MYHPLIAHFYKQYDIGHTRHVYHEFAKGKALNSKVPLLIFLRLKMALVKVKCFSKRMNVKRIVDGSLGAQHPAAGQFSEK